MLLVLFHKTTFYAIWLSFVCMRFLLAFWVFFAGSLAAQVTDSLRVEDPARVVAVDTLRSLEDIRRRPRNALLWSIVPGGGQVYNRRWWKVPLVYGGLLGMVAYADFNHTLFTRYERALENRCLGEGNVVMIPFSECRETEDEFDPARVTNQALIQARNNADRARQTAYIGIFIVYVLQGVEAYTDAHLQDFDISDDLTLRVGPIPGQEPGSFAYGVSLRPGVGSVRRQELQVERLIGR